MNLIVMMDLKRRFGKNPWNRGKNEVLASTNYPTKVIAACASLDSAGSSEYDQILLGVWREPLTNMDCDIAVGLNIPFMDCNIIG